MDTLDALEARLKTLLPEEYQETYESMQPVSMGSAGLKYGTDGKVAWDEIWGSFCDLAMAGGPPHKGTLLEPGSGAAIDAEPERYAEVVAEICRGIEMVTELPADPAPVPGWIRVECLTETMAGWLLRAIVMENVAVRAEGLMLDLPAAPTWHIGKEIKNVVTVIAKTCHYWMGHMPRVQQRAIAALFATMAAESPLVAPALAGEGAADEHDRIAAALARETGLHRSRHRYDGWLGLECANVGAAVWMMRALVASNILSRREGTVLFVPVNPLSDPTGEAVVRAVARVHQFATTRGVA
jgi:sirohydrochlorin cobaltochelatase